MPYGAGERCGVPIDAIVNLGPGRTPQFSGKRRPPTVMPHKEDLDRVWSG